MFYGIAVVERPTFTSVEDLKRSASRSEILGVKEIQDNPLTARVTQIFDKDGNGTVSFIESAS